MSFGGPNQPWQRNVMPFQQNVAPQQQYGLNFQGTNFQSSGVYGGGGAATVSYPQTYNSIGTVTKINNECGLVNDEVFFYRNVCKGQAPKLGDRVLFEATSSTTGQFKWNASRVQLMPPQPLMSTPISAAGISDHKSGGSRYGNYNSPPRRSSPMGRDRRDEIKGRSFRDRERENGRERIQRSREREDLDRKRRREELDRSNERQREARIQRSREREELDRKRRREDLDRSHERVEATRNLIRNPRVVRKERDHSAERKEKEQNVHEKEKLERNFSPRAGRGYHNVRIPKHSIMCKSLNVFDISERYPTLYIPSHFFEVDLKWHEALTLENPFSLHRPCQFHIMHESVEPLIPFKKEELEPKDEDYSFSAKVMLLSCPSLSEIYKKCFENDKEHLTRLLRFLLGTRGNNEPMAIGGAWSPSLDGANPDKDPAVLIRTAIRTCKALTGIDLSNCTQWYRFCELHYVHPKSTHVETVVIFLPDVHSCVPTTEEWQKLTKDYKDAGEKVIARVEKLEETANNSKTASDDADADDAKKTVTVAEKIPEPSTTTDEAVGTKTNNAEEKKQAENVAEESTAAEGVNSEAETQNTVGDSIDDNEKDGPQPTHHSKLDLKSMKVQEIRDELNARNLSSKGARNVIMARLAKAINTEKAEEIEKAKKAKKTETVVIKVENTEEDVEIVEINEENENNDKEAVEAGEDLKNEQEADNKTVEEQTSEKNEKTDDTEEHEDWNENMEDVDMNDIVILDEYDSSKNPERKQRMTKKERKQIRERYTLPKEPSIIVHPNKAAKSGKFDCLLLSLHRLQDHSLEHSNKQRLFEVFLFSRIFKEMLTRDFAFNIYKEIYLYSELKAKEASSKEEAKENGNAQIEKDEETNNEKGEEKASKDTNNADSKSEDGQSTKSALKRKENNENEKHKKMVTVKPKLLLSFLFFDNNHCGYFFVRDLSDLFKLVGINLSRVQTQKLLESLTARPSFDYRKLTDKEIASDAVPNIEDADNIDDDFIKKIFLGNFGLGKNLKNEAVGQDSSTEIENGMVNYKGTVVNVGKLMEQIQRTEKSFCDLEKLYNDLRTEHTYLQRDASRSNNKVKDLREEVKSLTRKLNDAHHDLSSLNRKHRDQHDAMVFAYKRLEPFVVREKEKDKKEEKDKEKKDEKDKEKVQKKEKNARSDKDKNKDKMKEKTEKTEGKNNGENENTSNDNGENNDDELENEEENNENQIEEENENDNIIDAANADEDAEMDNDLSNNGDEQNDEETEEN